MSIQATNLHRTKPGRSAELLAALQRALPDTMAHGGCEEIRLCRDQDHENKVMSITRWTSRAAYEEYLAWREGKGDTARFREMLVKDMEVHFYDEVFVVKPEKETEGTPATTTNSLVEDAGTRRRHGSDQRFVGKEHCRRQRA
jgi:quinol monooxygenase YgiN